MAGRYKSGPYHPTRGLFAGREFASKRQYENALAQLKGKANRYQLVRAATKPVGPKSHEKLRTSERQARSRALAVDLTHGSRAYLPDQGGSA